ncbi:MAG: hypothetical protein ACO38I_11010, partial [Ilumatobacteraceae bacterium]
VVDTSVTAGSVLAKGALVGASVHPAGGDAADGSVNAGAVGTVGSIDRPWSQMHANTLFVNHEVRTGVGDGLPVDRDLIIHWLDATRKDYGGNNGIADVNYVTVHGGTFTMERTDSRMFDASLTTAENGGIHATRLNFSMAFDLYIPGSAVDGAEMGICNYGGTSDTRYMNVYLDASGNLVCYSASSMRWEFAFDRADNWVHLTMSHNRNARTTRVWYDSVEQPLLSSSSSGYFDGPNDTVFYIGYYNKLTRPGVAFRNVRLYYNRALEGPVAHGVRMPAVVVDTSVTAGSVLAKGALVGASVHPAGGDAADGSVNAGAVGTVGSIDRPWSQMHANTVQVYDTLRVKSIETQEVIDESYEMFRYNGAMDESGNGNHLTFSTTDVLDTGRSLRMRTASGVAYHTTLDHVLYGSNFMAYRAERNHIFSFWVYMPSDAIDGSPVGLVHLGANTISNRASVVYLDASGNLAWSSGGSTVTNGLYRTFFTPFPTDKWAHVVVEVLTTSVIRAWYNGIEQAK